MGQQQQPLPNQPSKHGSTIILWIGIILFMVAIILGIYAILTKQNTVFLVISFGQAILTILIGIMQIAPNLLTQVRRTIKTGLLIIGISLLILSLTTNAYLLIRLQASSNINGDTLSPSSSTPTMTPTHIPPLVPALVQKDFQSDISSNAVTFPASVTDGDLIIVAITQYEGSVSSVTDNHGNTYTQVTAARHANTTTDYVELYYAKNVKGGVTTVTVTFSKTGNVGIYEYSGLDTTSPLDQVVSNAGYGIAPNGGTLITTKDNELYFAIGVDDDGKNSTPSAGSRYTLETHQDDSATNERFYSEDRISARGSYQTNFSIAVDSFWSVIGASFKPA